MKLLLRYIRRRRKTTTRSMEIVDEKVVEEGN